LPQTWEDPTFVHPDAEGCKGDNDPVDVVEIGAKIVPTGVGGTLSLRPSCTIVENKLTII
jgi:inorganic pyrophosphatase